ncbi:MAG: sigma-70 family RNA polymerase sigma factor [Saprospiraceae bacterium]|nr:sigma-70 family RNA polymerase sigma factor [Saprospiraceae bacterium]
MKNNEERQYVEAVLSGRTESFRHIIQISQPLVEQIVNRLVSKEVFREDMVQEIYIKVFQHLARFRFDCKRSTWIARIAYNYCLTELQSKKNLPLDNVDILLINASSHPDPLEESMSTDLKKIMDREIDQLPPLYKTILLLYHREEQSIEEIQTITGMPAGTIKSYLFRARADLAQRLSQKYKKSELGL